ncbi:hypothetical protein [Nonomuraea aridisoli]|uniref:Uncharacterized protein n=1 Tax=Nonomuraea aridisoli TaxID=2070368 RepID=A0A2W2E074_9ACTN|nr:hypothetical protein [Nonomuraea aridisoli]PZG17362.1 hypothetical protein C1J01_18175 [Nonomuraea aridisoli]
MRAAVADRDAASGRDRGLFVPLDVTRPEDNRAAVEAVEHILADLRTGQAWDAQAGQTAAPSPTRR